MIDFDILPQVGTTLKLDGQVYQLISLQPHTRLDGSPTILLVWLSTCPDCGDGFEVKTGLKSKGCNRRCAKCAKVGKPVNRKRGRRVKVEIS